jgi:hypothetical protein
MKYLRISFLFGLVLFGGSVSSHANTFHAGAVDPSCNANPPSMPLSTQCGIGFTDLGTTIDGVGFSQIQCTSAFIQPALTGLPADPTTDPYGCFLGLNTSGVAITSITLDFAPIPGVSGCDTILPDDSSPSIFTTNTCTGNDTSGYVLNFSGGPGVSANGGFFVIIEEGVPPGDFTGDATAFATPEPDSLLLLSTGTMMVGLYMTGRSRLFAFLKNKK